MMPKAITFSLLFFALILNGCSGAREVLGGLDARESINVVVTLRREHVVAQRIKTSSGRDELYSVEVAERDYPRALEILHEYGLPKGAASSFNQLTKAEGFSPVSPDTLDLRLDYALSVQVERVLQALPDIVDVRAVVRSRFGSSYANKQQDQKPTATVIVRYLSPSGNVPFALDDLKDIVARAVPGLRREDVAVNASRLVIPGERQLLNGTTASTEAADAANWVQLKPLVFRVPVEEKAKAALQIIIYLVLFCLAGGVIGYFWGLANMRRRYGRARKAVKQRGDKSIALVPATEGQNPDDTGKYLPRREGGKAKRTPEE